MENYDSTVICETEKEKNKFAIILDSILLPLLGAILGATVGAIPWAIVYYMGRFVSIMGALIAFCSYKGYQIFGGKNTTFKTVIIVIATIFGVVFGQVLGDVIGIISAMSEMDMEVLLFLHKIPGLYLELLRQPELMQSTLTNLGMGLFYGLIGCVLIIRRLNKS